MQVLLIDNYDSFTYNLVQYLGELGAEIDVVRNDVLEADELLERSAHYDGTVMAVRHRELPAEGVQFHPESVLTADGKRLLKNFLA